NGDGQPGLRCTIPRSRYAYTPTDQGPKHSEKSAIVTSNGTIKLTIFSDSRESVKQVVVGDSDVARENHSIVDTVESHLPATVSDCDTWQYIPAVVPDRNEERADAIVTIVYDHLGEDSCHPSMSCGVTNEFLLRRRVGSVNDK